MKTKSETRKQLRHLYNLKNKARETMRRNGYPLKSLDEPFQIIDYSIMTLKWVLGYKRDFKGIHYYCFKCKLMHRRLKCPECGGDKPLPLVETI